VLSGPSVTLRELRASDAPSLFAMLTADDVARFISPPPVSLDGFERFINWAQVQRVAGTLACFAVTLDASDVAVGIFQLRSLETGFGTAEWGFAIGSPYWGSTAFQEGAELMVQFAFDAVGVHRVMVNGTTIVVDGAETGARPGTVLRSGRDTYTVPIPADT
jgi:RimJ/RimL family protein N-acetyltransferase